jgi:hypothetical protein
MPVLIGMWLWDSAADIIHIRFRYSVEYTTDEANVFNSPKPHELRFLGRADRQEMVSLRSHGGRPSGAGPDYER